MESKSQTIWKVEISQEALIEVLIINKET